MPDTDTDRSSTAQTLTSPMPLITTRALLACNCSPLNSALPDTVTDSSRTSPATWPSPAPETLKTSWSTWTWSKRASPAPEMWTPSLAPFTGPTAVTSAAPRMASRTRLREVICICSRVGVQKRQLPWVRTRSMPPCTSKLTERCTSGGPATQT